MVPVCKIHHLQLAHNFISALELCKCTLLCCPTLLLPLPTVFIAMLSFANSPCMLSTAPILGFSKCTPLTHLSLTFPLPWPLSQSNKIALSRTYGHQVGSHAALSQHYRGPLFPSRTNVFVITDQFVMHLTNDCMVYTFKLWPIDILI